MKQMIVLERSWQKDPSCHIAAYRTEERKGITFRIQWSDGLDARFTFETPIYNQEAEKALRDFVHDLEYAVRDGTASGEGRHRSMRIPLIEAFRDITHRMVRRQA